MTKTQINHLTKSQMIARALETISTFEAMPENNEKQTLYKNIVIDTARAALNENTVKALRAWEGFAWRQKNEILKVW